jgi:membrane-associated protease RseP (regulator of RpoE activity)
MRVSYGLFLLVLGFRGSGVPAAELPPPGLVVVAVVPDGPAAKAGVQVGDVLRTYDGTALVFPSSLDEAKEKAEAAQKETVTVELRRGEERLPLTLPVGKMGLGVRPPLPLAAQALWEEGRALPEEAYIERAGKWQAAAEAAQQAGDARAAAWLWGEAGGQWNAAQSFDRAAAAYGQAAAQSQAAGQPKAQALQSAQAVVWEREGWAHPFYWAGFELLGAWE